MDNNGLPVIRNRRYSWASSSWTPYVGDLKALETYLDSKYGVLWFIPKFIDSLLRGIGQVAFANNPVSGLLILIALFVAGIDIGLAALLASTTAILTALIMRMEPSSIRAGLTTFNAVLVGAVTASLWTPLYNEPLTTKIWAFIVLGSVLSVVLASGLGNILSRWNLPGLTLPFNVVNLLLFTCLKPPRDGEALAAAVPNDTAVDWLQVVYGSTLALGEVFAVDTLLGSILIFVALFIYSPLLGIMSSLGGLLGTVFALLFVSSYSNVYLGIWGYNGVLSAGALGGFFFAPNIHAFLIALLNVVFTTILQHALAIAFVQYRLPVLTLPFVLSTLIFLSVSTSGKYLSRVTNISFPEMHRHDYVEELRAAEASSIREQMRIKEAGHHGALESSLP